MSSSRKAGPVRPDPGSLVPGDTVPALDPAVLHGQAEQSARALLKEGGSANTVRSYAAALRYRRDLTLPVAVPVVVQFLVDHVERIGTDSKRVPDLPAAIDRPAAQHPRAGLA
jgi:hypothetical protein